MQKKTEWAKKKIKIKLEKWIIHVKTTRNNTVVTLTNEAWNKIFGGGTWNVWYKWSKKKTPYAAEMLTKDILEKVKDYWLKEVSMVMKWVGLWREWVFKAVNDIWTIEISQIREATPIQFGGCKRKRSKRV